MATTKKLGLSILAVLSVLLIGGMAWAVAGNATGNKTRERNGNMTQMQMRGGGFGGGPGGMHGIFNASSLGLSANASAEEIKAALEEKRNETEEKRKEQQAAIDAALVSGDYDAWKAAVENMPMGGRFASLTSIITKENFDKYAEMEGYLAKAKALASELGLDEKGIDNGRHMGMGGPRCGMEPPAEAATLEASE